MPVCRVGDIGDPGARGFVLGDGDRRIDLVVVRRGGRTYAYVNACPHIGTPLEFRPDQFLTADKTRLLCSTHGAQFEIHSGLCVRGPCLGRSLKSLKIRVDGENVSVALD